MFGVNPRVVKLNYILVLQSLKQVDFRIEALQVIRVPQHISHLHLIPSNFYAFQFVKCFIADKSPPKLRIPASRTSHYKNQTRRVIKNKESLEQIIALKGYTVLKAPFPNISRYCKMTKTTTIRDQHNLFKDQNFSSQIIQRIGSEHNVVIISTGYINWQTNA